MNTKTLLDQAEVWITADRMPIPLGEMDAGHRRNTLAMLRRRAGYLRKAYDWCGFQVFRSAPDDVFAEWLSEQKRTVTDDPADWLERRPLVRELARLVALDGQPDVVDGEIVMHELPARSGEVAVRQP